MCTRVVPNLGVTTRRMTRGSGTGRSLQRSSYLIQRALGEAVVFGWVGGVLVIGVIEVDGAKE